MKNAFMVKLDGEAEQLIERDARLFGSRSAAIRFWLGVVVALIKTGTIPRTFEGLQQILLSNRCNAESLPVRRPTTDSLERFANRADGSLQATLFTLRHAAMEDLVARAFPFLGTNFSRRNFSLMEIVYQ